jgi:predicted transcriptional regulator
MVSPWVALSSHPLASRCIISVMHVTFQILKPETRQVAAGRRSAFEVRMDILKVASAGSAKPTHIMYKSNTSWTVLQKNLESLLVGGFMSQSGEGSRVEYGITSKGIAVLHDYNRLVEEAGPRAVEARQ